MGRRTVAAALCGRALLLVGCGSSDASPTSSAATVNAAPEPSPTPAANEYVDAVVHTRGLGTAKTEIILTSTIGSQSRDLTAEGGLDLASGYGDLTWRGSDGSVVRERSNGKGLFVQSGGPSSTWEKRAGVDASSTGRVADVLRGLGTLGGLQLAGTEVFQGLTFHRYTGEVPVSAQALGQLGIGSEDAAAIAAAAPDAMVQVTVWIDPSGRVVRVDRAIDVADTSVGPVSATTTTRLTEFSGDLDLSPPPSESVVSAPAS